MFLALFYHSGDVKEFGWAAVLKPLLMELQMLENPRPARGKEMSQSDSQCRNR